MKSKTVSTFIIAILGSALTASNVALASLKEFDDSSRFEKVKVGRADRVIDGDTVEFTLPNAKTIVQRTAVGTVRGSESTTLRLRCIDTQETKNGKYDLPPDKQKLQPFGPDATKRVEQLLQKAKNIEIAFELYERGQNTGKRETDLNGRFVGDILVDGKSVGETLTTEGLAVIKDTETKRRCGRYFSAQNIAKARKVKIWSLKTPIMPWDFRKNK